MYTYVRVQEPEAYYAAGPESVVKVRLEQASGEHCLVVPYREFNLKLVRDLKPRAIAMSGFGGHFQSRKVEWFHGMAEVMHEADLPMICFCGSHQLLGFAFNRDLGKVKRLHDEPMRKLRPGEHWPRQPMGADPKYVNWRYFQAVGFFPIRQVRKDPLFKGLPQTMTLCCSHYCEVKKLPADFVLLASSDHCRIEAMKHRTRPIYGTQFHPEKFEAPYFHGRKMLENFAGIVREFWKKR